MLNPENMETHEWKEGSEALQTGHSLRTVCECCPIGQ